MIRKIIQIDEDKCNGCGACAAACHEGAIGMVDGKAKLLRADYCDGLGDCLPACPTKAIYFIEQEYSNQTSDPLYYPENNSQLTQWPVQIKLAPTYAPYFQNADLLIAADCTAYAYGNFHNKFIRNRITLIGCPKLDGINYAEKLTEIIRNNAIKSLTIVRMQVPCCGGLEQAVKTALQASEKFIPWHVVVIGTNGTIISE
mgnify:FL=1